MGERILVLGILASLAACGGGGGEPLLSGTMTGEYDGQSFTAVNGFATIVEDTPLVAMGEGGIGCGSEDDNQPPGGYNVAFGLEGSVFAVGDFTSVFVEFHRNVGGDYEGFGTNVGSVSITAVTTESVSGTIAFDYTDDESRHFAANGTFEVVNCVP
jgi:hypothetical protein